jgi:hypothetical protein
MVIKHLKQLKGLPARLRGIQRALPITAVLVPGSLINSGIDVTLLYLPE